MSNTAYYLAWLAAGLLATGIASALIARRTHLHAVRRIKAEQLLDALARYSDWAAAQRRAMLFQPDAWGGDAALEEVLSLQRVWFAPLAGDAQRLADVHAQLVDFLWKQQLLRLGDAEAWLLSDPDAKFMTLWRLQCEASQAFAEKLAQLSGLPDSGFEPGSTFPA